jgi:hypothetical protein
MAQLRGQRGDTYRAAFCEGGYDICEALSLHAGERRRTLAAQQISRITLCQQKLAFSGVLFSGTRPKNRGC